MSFPQRNENLKNIFDSCGSLYKVTQAMSQFRIQRKLTEAVSIKPRIPIAARVRSLQSKHSLSRTPKRAEHQSLKKIVQRIAIRRPTEESDCSKGRIEARMQEGIRAYNDKSVSKATQIFKEVYKNGIKSAELTFYLGSCLLNTGKHQKSIIYLNQCISLDPAYSPHAYLYIAVNFKFLNNLRQAIKVLSEGLALFPQFEEGVFYRGKMFMKMGQFHQAIDSFIACLKINASNELASLFLGDCFKAIHNTEKAITTYRKILKKKAKFADLAGLRIAVILLEQQHFQKALELLTTIQRKGSESAELHFYLGVACCGLQKKQEGAVYYEACLAATKEAPLATRVLKNIIKLSVADADFYQAEHDIKRINSLQLSQDKFKEWILLVEGVGDLIKRKNSNGVAKLQRAMQIAENRLRNERVNLKQTKQFLSYVYSYLGYATFITNQLQASLQIWEKALAMNEGDKHNIHCSLIVEALWLQSQGQLQRAVSKFKQAFDYQARPEALFMAAITLVHIYKQIPQMHDSPERKGQLFDEVEECLLKANNCNVKHSLLLFYYALVQLFMNKPCSEVIEAAIDACDEPVSEYYFIYALTLKEEGKLHQALQMITKAIDIDPGILQFYRQRSKYYFMVENYHEAIEDCRRAEEMEPKDEEIILLLSFFHYLLDDVETAYSYLSKVKPSSGKLREFQLALCLRKGIFEKLGELGYILGCLQQSKQVDSEPIAVIQRYIEEREQFSQFSVYFFHLLLAAVCASNNQHEKGTNHLFGCLEEIQMLIDQKDSQNRTFEITWEETQIMLDEVKFNITILTMMAGVTNKVYQNFEETEKYITIFSKQTSNQELKMAFDSILKLIKDKNSEGTVELFVENETPKISDFFLPFRIPIHKTVLVDLSLCQITRFLLSYPAKLKFTISPQFDPSYLLNFDLQKIQYKLPPPWLKSPEKRLNFTNQMCNQSIKLSQSQLSSQKDSRKSFMKGSIVQHLKLNRSVEQKLDRMIGK